MSNPGLSEDEEFDIIAELGNDDTTTENQENVAERKKPAKRSSAWDHFDEIEENGIRYAVCRHCVDK